MTLNDRWSGRLEGRSGPTPGSKGSKKVFAGSTINGFPCPKCSERSAVKETRQDIDGALKRRRQCSTCSHRFTTYENVVDKLSATERQQYRLFLKLKPKLIELADSIDLLSAEHD